MSNFFWYRHIPHHGAPRTGGGALSLLSPGAIFMVFAMLLLFAPRIAFGFLAVLFLLVGGVLLYIGITFWRIKKQVLQDFESMAANQFGAQPWGDKSFFSHRSHFTHMRSRERETTEKRRDDYDSVDVATYEIDVDSIEVLDPEPDHSGKRKRRWYRLH